MPERPHRGPSTCLGDTLTVLVTTHGGARAQRAAALALQALPGVLEVTINPRTHTAFVRCDPRTLDPNQLRAAIAPAQPAPRQETPDPHPAPPQAG